ncbi:MAG: ATP-dependent DNA helicase RecG [Acutalibacteraceae bacterium]
MFDENRPIEYLSGIGKKRAELFNKLGIDTVGALLEFYPRLYEDWSNCYDVSDAPIDEQCCVKATVATRVESFRIRKGLTLFKFKVTDGKMPMYVTIFNNKYAAAKVELGEEVLLYGKVSGNFNRREMSSPQIEHATAAHIRPIYRQCEGLNSKIIEKAVKQALSELDESLYDPIPDDIRAEYKLCHKYYAIEKIHFPDSYEEMQIAKRRLVFEELLTLQLGMIMLKSRSREQTAQIIASDYTAEFIKSLPFELTGAQKRAVADAVSDMAKPVPMNRLLQGDVGSGKTAVAAALMYNVAKNGCQSALMAPTEILAEQHYYSLSKMLRGNGITIALLTGSTPTAERRKILSLLMSGGIDIVIGTHALIQNDVDFAHLALVITDEQHRFGVNQRAALSGKSEHAHTYVMSATPIPRTLALIVYGDLDISVLDELPKGRQPIETYCVSTKLRLRAYNYVKKHLNEGRQGYVVCPMVEEGEMQLASAVSFYEKLQAGVFKGYSVGLLHGKMKPDEKDAVMRDFASGKIQLLVATTVIEVGIDVPNAVIMVIENAERFGLSQLHQLRGRVGRGEHQSTCILISDADNDESQKRLQVMCETNDGFKIADADLKLRGPGDFFGSKQHGLPTLKIASIFDDMSVLKETQRLAKRIDLNDEKYFGLKNAALQLFENAKGGLN